eukprot:9335409-Heterocapsa_arctica.AAC.1
MSLMLSTLWELSAFGELSLSDAAAEAGSAGSLAMTGRCASRKAAATFRAEAASSSPVRLSVERALGEKTRMLFF